MHRYRERRFSVFWLNYFTRYKTKDRFTASVSSSYVQNYSQHIFWTFIFVQDVKIYCFIECQGKGLPGKSLLPIYWLWFCSTLNSHWVSFFFLDKAELFFIFVIKQILYILLDGNIELTLKECRPLIEKAWYFLLGSTIMQHQ